MEETAGRMKPLSFICWVQSTFYTVINKGEIILQLYFFSHFHSVYGIGKD